MLFDMKAEIGLPIPCVDGIKKVIVRYPSDQEFIDWRLKKKLHQKDLGRRKFEIDPSKPEPCDVALVNAIRKDQETGPEINDSEASFIVGRLLDANVSDLPERVGSLYTVRMKVMRKLLTSHTLRVPSVKEMMDYERMRSGVVFGQYGRQEIRINWQASIELYDSLKKKVEGYAGDIPVPHKAEAVNVLLQEINAELEEEPESEDDQD